MIYHTREPYCYLVFNYHKHVLGANKFKDFRVTLIVRKKINEQVL